LGGKGIKEKGKERELKRRKEIGGLGGVLVVGDFWTFFILLKTTNPSTCTRAGWGRRGGVGSGGGEGVADMVMVQRRVVVAFDDQTQDVVREVATRVDSVDRCDDGAVLAGCKGEQESFFCPPFVDKVGDAPTVDRTEERASYQITADAKGVVDVSILSVGGV